MKCRSGRAPPAPPPPQLSPWRVHVYNNIMHFWFSKLLNSASFLARFVAWMYAMPSLGQSKKNNWFLFYIILAKKYWSKERIFIWILKTQCIFCILIFYLPILGVVKASTFRYFTSIFSPVLSQAFFDPSVDLGPGAQLGNFERGARYIFIIERMG